MKTRKPFRFKQFSVTDTHSAMKLNTDGVLLGSWVEIENAESALDIGTGCGIIALMIAQRSAGTLVDAIDLEAGSIIDASSNFQISPWNERLTAIHSSLKDFAGTAGKKYDLIVSNPPYFHDSLRSPTEQTNRSKHNLSLSYSALFRYAACLLEANGRLAIIVPFSDLNTLAEIGWKHKMSVCRELQVRPLPAKPPFRALAEFARGKRTLEKKIEQFSIRDHTNSYSDEYIGLHKQFYLDC